MLLFAICKYYHIIFKLNLFYLKYILCFDNLNNLFISTFNQVNEFKIIIYSIQFLDIKIS